MQNVRKIYAGRCWSADRPHNSRIEGREKRAVQFTGALLKMQRQKIRQTFSAAETADR